MSKTFLVEFERSDEDNGDAGTGLSDEDQLHRELQAACDAGLLVGRFRVERRGSVSPASEVVLPSTQVCALVPPDQLNAFFVKLRETARDSLSLLRILGMPSNAKVVEVWREFAASESSEEQLSETINAKIKQLEAMNEVLREVSGALYGVRSAQNDLEDALGKAEEAVNEAGR